MLPGVIQLSIHYYLAYSGCRAWKHAFYWIKVLQEIISSVEIRSTTTSCIGSVVVSVSEFCAGFMQFETTARNDSQSTWDTTRSKASYSITSANESQI